MKEIKVQVASTTAHKRSKIPVKGRATARVRPIVARRGRTARSIVDDTYAALSVRKHAKIELLIDQATYGD